MKQELELSEETVQSMVVNSSGRFGSSISGRKTNLYKSESYGEGKHRVWTFVVDGSPPVAHGSIERYYDGLKMIFSIFGGTPMTRFFTALGERVERKSLISTSPDKTNKQE